MLEPPASSGPPASFGNWGWEALACSQAECGKKWFFAGSFLQLRDLGSPTPFLLTSLMCQQETPRAEGLPLMPGTSCMSLKQSLLSEPQFPLPQSEQIYFILFLFWLHYSMQKFLGQGLNPHHSSVQSHSSDNAGSLTSCVPRGFHEQF